MLQHVFNNHNNINMNDIQNSNNYSHIITLPGGALATRPGRLAVQRSCIKFCLRSIGCAVFTLAYTECTARDLIALNRRCSQRVNKGCVSAFVVHARYLSWRCRRMCSQSAAGRSRVCNSIKKELEGLWGGRVVLDVWWRLGSSMSWGPRGCCCLRERKREGINKYIRVRLPCSPHTNLAH